MSTEPPSMDRALPLPTGFVWCAECQASKQPHRHGGDQPEPQVPESSSAVAAEGQHSEIEALITRAEFAESLLCALAFDHQRSNIWIGVRCWLWPMSCAFCERPQ